MNEQPAQNPIIDIQSPQTLREVGIHLENINKTIIDFRDLQQKQHAENLKKMDEIQKNCPTREEFTLLKEDVEQKAAKWVEKTLIYIGGIVGLAIIGAIMDLILRK